MDKPNTSVEALNITNELFRGSAFFEFKANNEYHSAIGKIEASGVWGLENSNTTLVLDAERFWHIKKITPNELVLMKGYTDEIWTFSSVK